MVSASTGFARLNRVTAVCCGQRVPGDDGATERAYSILIIKKDWNYEIDLESGIQSSTSLSQARASRRDSFVRLGSEEPTLAGFAGPSEGVGVERGRRRSA